MKASTHSAEGTSPTKTSACQVRRSPSALGAGPAPKRLASSAVASSSGHAASTVSAEYSTTSSPGKRAAPRVYQIQPSVPTKAIASPTSVAPAAAGGPKSRPETIATPASAIAVAASARRAGRTPSKAQRTSCVVMGVVATITAPCEGTECASPTNSSTLKTPKPAPPRSASGAACRRSLRHGGAPRGSSSAANSSADRL